MPVRIIAVFSAHELLGDQVSGPDPIPRMPFASRQTHKSHPSGCPTLTAGRKGRKKLSICLQAQVSGVSVARRYAMNTNLIYKWLREPRFSSEDQAADLPMHEGATFLPVEVAGRTPATAAPISPTPLTGSATAQRMDITLSDGRRILVEGATALSAVLAMVEGLAQATARPPGSGR